MSKVDNIVVGVLCLVLVIVLSVIGLYSLYDNHRTVSVSVTNDWFKNYCVTGLGGMFVFSSSVVSCDLSSGNKLYPPN